MTLQLLLYIIAVALLGLAAFGFSPRVSFGWLGLTIAWFAFAILPAIG